MFVDIPYVNYFSAIMVYVFQMLQIPEPFHFHIVLLTRISLHAWSKLSNNIEDSQEQFEEKDISKH